MYTGGAAEHARRLVEKRGRERALAHCDQRIGTVVKDETADYWGAVESEILYGDAGYAKPA